MILAKFSCPWPICEKKDYIAKIALMQREINTAKKAKKNRIGKFAAKVIGHWRHY